MSNLNVYEILGYGVIGLGFLLAFLAFTLLTREQKREAPRGTILAAIYIFMVFSLALCLIGFVADTQKSENGSSANQQQIDSLRQELTHRLSAADLAVISDTYFSSESDKQELLTGIKHLIEQVEEIKKEQTHYAYKLFKLEKMLPQFGGNINTRVRDERRTSIYRLIQDVMQGINFYQGIMDGQQAATFEAVKRFQEQFNERAGQIIFEPENLGIFGYRTLEAIRSTYRMATN